MSLTTDKDYFLSDTDAVLRADSNGDADAVNHLLFGDWMRYLGDETTDWAKVRCRGSTGWLPKVSFSENRPLEVNFVDIGQGDGCHIVTPDDEVILIDAGVGDNMFRFLNWRYNLRHRKVAGVEGVQDGDDGAVEPFEIDYVFISHPDKDHYYGFKDVFECRKLSVQRIFHNGIVERPIDDADEDPDLWYPSGGDLGGFVVISSKLKYLWDVVDSNAGMHDLISAHPDTGKYYLSTLRAAVKNNEDVVFKGLSADDDFVEGFEEDKQVALKILGPLTEEVTHGTETKPCLFRLGDEGVTKNGHSIILQLRIGNLRVMLGGDLNTESEDYLLKHYAETDSEASELESTIMEIKAKGNTASSGELQDLAEAETELQAIVTKGRRHFQVDVTKACHHGSHHFSETFLKVLNTIVTVISSGDDENYAHPRPDALGSFGRYGRGIRPLIFSTELARNTREFTPIYEHYEALKEYEARIEAAATDDEKDAIKTEMQEAKDRNVVVYGMITLRTDGHRVVLAQKLEVSGGAGNKWDIHELHYNENNGEFEYAPSAKGH